MSLYITALHGVLACIGKRTEDNQLVQQFVHKDAGFPAQFKVQSLSVQWTEVLLL